MQLMHEYAAPYNFEGKGEKKDILCLMIHGFTGSPAHLLELGQELNREGYSVRSILLKGHGTSPEDMEKTNAQDWIQSVEEAYAQAKNDFGIVNIVSLSMGALISLILASKNHDINKLVCMSAPLRFRNKMVKLTPILKYVKRFNEIVPPPVQEGENDELDIGYKKTPVKCVPHLIKISKIAEKSLPHVTTPLLIINSYIDGQVHPDSGRIIYNKSRSQKKEILWLENSKHIITLGLQRRLVFQEIIRFLNS